MTYTGQVKNGVIALDDAVPLPEGARVEVELLESPLHVDDDLSAVLLRHAGKGKGLPPDLAANHDHYAHGKPTE